MKSVSPMIVSAGTLQQLEAIKQQYSTQNLEFEARWGIWADRRFKPGVGLRTFARLRDHFTQLGIPPTLLRQRDEYYDNNIRISTQLDRAGNPMGDPVKITKQLIQNFDDAVTSYHFRIGVSIERATDEAPQGQPIKRLKNRTSYNLGIVRLDLTEIESTTGTNYEVELELLSPLTPIDRFVEEIKKMVLEVQGTFLIYTEAERETVFNQLNGVLNEGGGGFLQNKVLMQPRNLKFADMVFGGLIPRSERDVRYTVTVKADGMRKLLFFGKDGIYFISPPDDMMKLTDRTVPIFIGTIIEGELIPKENREDQEPLVYFLMYDALASMGKDIRKQSHFNRLETASEVARLMANRPQVYFAVKAFFPFSTATEFFSQVRRILNSNHRFKTDGLIFTPDNSPYNAAVNDIPLSRRVLTRQPDILKWKPPNQLTIDFEIYHTAENNRIDLLSSIPLYWRREQIRELDSKYWYLDRQRTNNREVFTGTNDHPFNSEKDLLINPLIKTAQSGSIIEFRWTIGQVNPNVLETPNGGVMEAIRLRHDKASPNNLNVALDVWEDIHSPLNTKLMLGETFGLVFRYHNREKSRLYSATSGGVLLDIGSGRGGDVIKWVKNKYTHVICVEPDNNNRVELARRLSFTGLQSLIIPTTGQDTDTIISQVRKFSPTQKVDTISMMLSLSFFNDYTPIKQLVDELLTSNGSFIALTPDGQLIQGYFNNPVNYMESNGVRVANLQQISMQLSEDRKVFINIPDSIVQQQTEFLVDIPKLIQTLGMTPTLQFQTDKETFMNPEELQFSRLFVGLQLKRSTTELPLDQFLALKLQYQTQQVGPLLRLIAPGYASWARPDPTTGRWFLVPEVSYDQLIAAQNSIASFQPLIQADKGNTWALIVDKGGNNYLVRLQYNSQTGQSAAPIQ